MVAVLVTGGAGYIGSHCCLALSQAGYKPVVYDNLSSGHPDFVKWGALEIGDVRDAARLTDVIRKHRPKAVLHFAGLIEVGASVTNPSAFYEQNVSGSLVLMDTMRREGLSNLVFSSTCAIFGVPDGPILDERHPTRPSNPYGRTKLMVEQASHDFEAAYGLRHVHLRYFNAAGAAPEQRPLTRGRAHDVGRIVTAYAPTGYAADALDRARAEAAGDGIVIETVLRGWVARAWPHATRGFFPFTESASRGLFAMPESARDTAPRPAIMSDSGAGAHRRVTPSLSRNR